MIKARLLALFCLVPVNAVSAQTTVTVGIAEIDYPPYQEFVNGEVVGPDIDLTREAFARLPQYRVQYKVVPIQRAVIDSRNGLVDAVAVAKTDATEQYGYFTEYPLHVSDYRVVVPKDSSIRFDNWSDLYGKRIAVVFGHLVNKDFQALVDSGKLHVNIVSGFEEQLRMLASGRVDAIIGNREILAVYAKRQGMLGQVRYLPKPVNPRFEFHLAVPRKAQGVDPIVLIDDLAKAFRSMHNDGSWHAIVDRHWNRVSSNSNADTRNSVSPDTQ